MRSRGTSERGSDKKPSRPRAQTQHATPPPGPRRPRPALGSEAPRQLLQPLRAGQLGAAGREAEGWSAREEEAAPAGPPGPRGSEPRCVARGGETATALRGERGGNHAAPRARSGTARDRGYLRTRRRRAAPPAGHSPAVGPFGHEPRQDAADHPPEDGHNDDGHRQATVRHGGAAAERSAAPGGARSRPRRAAPRPAGQSAAATSPEREAAPFAARGAVREAGRREER